MRRLLSVALLSLTLVGCTDTLDKLRRGYEGVEAAVSSQVVGTVAPRVAISAMATYDGLVVVATKYQGLTRCTGTNGPVCRDPAWRPTIDAAVYAGRTARNNLKAFMRAHPGDGVPSTLYDAIVATSNTLDEATASYRAALGSK